MVVFKMKKKLFFPIIVAFLSIALLSPLLIEVANAAFIFSDGFESGNLNAWTVTYGALSINNQTVNSGGYSVQNTVVGHNENLYYQALGSSLPNPIYLREYIYINSTTVPSTPGDYYEVGGFSTTQGGNYGDGEICVFNVAGTLYWGMYYRDFWSNSSGFSFVISNSNTTSTAHEVEIGWHCVELESTTAGNFSEWGKEQLYLNGESIINATTHNSDRVPANVVLGGSHHIASSSDRWNYYVDDVVVGSSYIGPLLYQLTTSTNFGTVNPESGLTAKDQTVQIIATAPVANSSERYIWQGWVGSGVGSYTGPNNPATVTIGSNITEQAVWEHDYYLTVTSAYGTVGGTGWYNSNSSSVYASVTPLTVAGATGTQYVFIGWSGDASGGTSPSNPITMNGNKTATANWKTQYYLNVSSVNGTVGGTGWYDSGTNASATLNSLTVAGATGTQYIFTGWSANASGTTSPSNPITMNDPKTAIANWKTQYNLTLAQSGVGSDFSGNVITVNGTSYNRAGFTTWANSSDVYTFSYAPQVLVAENSKQCLITGVSGNTTATYVTVSNPSTVTAAYKTQYFLTVASDYDSPSPTSGWFDDGTSITGFVSSPASGYACSGWSGTGSVPASGSSSVVTFAITAPSSIAWNWFNPTATPSPTAIPSPTATPTPRPTATTTPKPTPSTSPSPSPSPTASSTPKPTNTSPTPSSSGSTQNFATNPYIYGIVIAIVIVGILAALILLRRRRAKKKLS
jgi:uncharacterized repeat protein (TIGR02543 family)